MKSFTRILCFFFVIVLCFCSFSTSSFAQSNHNLVTDTNVSIEQYQIAPKIACTEDSETYRITLYDSETRSTYNLDLSLTGDKSAHTVTATLSNTFAIGFSSIDVTLQLYSTRYSTTLRGTAYDNDLNLGESISVTHTNVSYTAKYYAVVTGTANGGSINYSTYHIPFNSRGEKYPTDITSPVTGESLPYNFSVTLSEIPQSDWVPWNQTIRDQYEAYLGEDLTGYDVHHIVPRRYGGTNAYSNLIPLAHPDHSRVTNWWLYY